MNWDESRSGGIVLCQARVSDVDADVIVEIWTKFLALFNDKPSGKWDSIKIEVWADSGRIIIFPGVAGRADRDEEYCLEIRVESLFNFFEQISDSDIDDEAFDNHVNGHVRGLIDRLDDGLEKTLKNDSSLSPDRKLELVYSDSERTIFQTSI